MVGEGGQTKKASTYLRQQWPAFCHRGKRGNYKLRNLCVRLGSKLLALDWDVWEIHFVVARKGESSVVNSATKGKKRGNSPLWLSHEGLINCILVKSGQSRLMGSCRGGEEMKVSKRKTRKKACTLLKEIWELWLSNAEPNFWKFATMRRALLTNPILLPARHGSPLGWVLFTNYHLDLGDRRISPLVAALAPV